LVCVNHFLFVSRIAIVRSNRAVIALRDAVAVLAVPRDTPITLTGANFNSSTVVSVNTVPATFSQNLPTSFVNESTVQAVIPAGLLVSPRSLVVTVSNAGVSSPNVIEIFVESTAPPSVSSIHPDGGARGMSGIPLGIAGEDLDGAVVSSSGTGVTFLGHGPVPGAFIAADAPLGPQLLTVTTLAGSTTRCGAHPCTFTVVDGGTWADARRRV